MNILPCPCIDGTDGYWDGTDIQSDACPCCEGRALVELRHVPSDYLYAFKDAQGITEEMHRRGFSAWVLELGRRVPGTTEDVAGGCELIGWVRPVAEAAE